jgi:hypothetical protein
MSLAGGKGAGTRGTKVRSAKTTVLTAKTFTRHNTFAEPDTVQLRAGEIKVTDATVVATVPAASLVKVEMELE